MDAECTRLVNLLGTGERNKISRKTLANLLGVCDREMRDAVKRAQLEKVPIVNFGGGYYICENLNEMLGYIRRERKRSSSINEKCDRLLYTEWFD